MPPPYQSRGNRQSHLLPLYGVAILCFTTIVSFRTIEKTLDSAAEQSSLFRVHGGARLNDQQEEASQFRVHGGARLNDQKKEASHHQLFERKRKGQCEFREYPPRRYFGLSQTPRLDFLQNASFIYGEYPIILESRYGGKICVNQTAWYHPSDERLPFADGTNPSILRIDRLPASSLTESLQTSHEGVYLATIGMTKSQCAWKDTPEEREQYHISEITKPSTLRTILLVLNGKFETMLETTILLERDAEWGKKVKPKKKRDGSFKRQPKPFSDARLFLNHDSVWMSYREGRGFGFEHQVINKIHIELVDDVFSAFIKASETASFCCGRNMALMQSPVPSLQSLTWVDPITVEDVDDTKHGPKPKKSNKSKQRRSDFHGTNGFMVPLEDSSELLGIGHFHRPAGRDKNEYAKFGHHYTHAFFTITQQAPHRLKRLSQEIVFPSKSHVFVDDADIIQFASGLELDQDKGNLVVAYGINDCEGAIVTIDMKVIEKLLLPVQDGLEVIDLLHTLNLTD
jgi:hypothetical protein